MSRFSTDLVHSAQKLVTEAGEVVEPIFLSACFHQKSFSDLTGFGYGRIKNPSREAIEQQIAVLEGGKHGFAFSSGMAAIHAIFSLFSTGDKVLLLGCTYGATQYLLDKIFSNFGIKHEVVIVEQPEDLESFITPDVKAIYFESPTNPTIKVNDIRAICSIAKKHSILSVVDNTFMSPYLQQPLKLGADIVLESASKFLCGHNDIIGGILALNDDDLAQRIYELQKYGGGVMQPFDAYLLGRSIKTLGVRMDRQAENALTIARYLEKHPGISVLHYPGLESDPGYEIQMSQAKNGGTMISFELSDGYHLETFVDSLKLIIMGGSLGSVETLICHSVSTSHDHVPADIRESVEITDKLLRLSVGIEDVNDIMEDLDQAFQRSIIQK